MNNPKRFQYLVNSFFVLNPLFIKGVIVLLFQFMLFNEIAFSQSTTDSLIVNELEMSLKAIKNDSINRLNYGRLIRYSHNARKNAETDTILNDFQKKINNRRDSMMENNTELNEYHCYTSNFVKNLFELERNNYDQEKLKPITIKKLQEFTGLDDLTAIMRQVLNNLDENSSGHKQMVRDKLIQAISEQMKVIADNSLAWYNYNTVEKKWIKGVQIETSNDLFAWSNNDVDYTGALKLSVSTDLFKINGLWPTKSYQNIIYGGEVFTPYFKDTSIFIKDDTFNMNDRPHACFEYVGYEFNGISYSNIWRWSARARIGIIGGRFGYNFQYFLHRDISLSPYPYGWGAQIGLPGRLALQGNFKLERLLCAKQANLSNNSFRIIPSFSAEVAVGHYMTFTELGVNLSTQNFKHRNQDNILPKTKYFTGLNKIGRAKGYANLNLNLRYVIHNTMLEGFGVINNSENNDGTFAEKSKHVINEQEVRPFVFYIGFTVGAQLSRVNIFYKYNVRTPEVELENPISIDGKSINERWHHYASIGINFIL